MEERGRGGEGEGERGSGGEVWGGGGEQCLVHQNIMHSLCTVRSVLPIPSSPTMPS